MKKNYLVYVLAFVLVIGLSACGMSTDTNNTDSSRTETNTERPTTTLSENQDDDEMQDDEDMSSTSMFNLTDGTSVSYNLTKKWLGRPGEEVTGTTPEVTGNVQYNNESNTLTGIDITVDAQTFDSGSAGRDNWTDGILGQNITIVLAEPVAVNMGTFSETVPLNVTVNGQTKEVDFQVQGDISDSTMEATGEGFAAFTDFGIDPPGILNVYTADDRVNFSFSLKADIK